MKLTIFSGTFNPIHNAHLIIAESVRDELGLDEVTFIPNFTPPHREDNIALPEHRLNMTKLAIEDNSFFKLSDIEFQRQDRSYTINTVKAIKELYTGLDEKINLIIGTDAFKLIDSWYQAEELAKLVKFIIVARPNDEVIVEVLANIKLDNFEYTIVNAPLLDISSSYIRDKIKNNRSIKYLVPQKVENYIYEHGLYRKD